MALRQAMPEAGPAVKPKARALVTPALAPVEAGSRAAVALTGAACRFPLEGTTPAEMWEQLVGKTVTWLVFVADFFGVESDFLLKS